MFSLAIFDLDGTLLNTLEDLHAAVNFALRRFGFPERTVNEVRSFIGNGVVKLMERSVPEGTDEKTREDSLSVFREYYLSHMADNTAPYEDTKELLLSLKEKGVKTAVVSNKLHSAVVGLCNDYFPHLIDIAFGVSEESERKPCPVNVLKVLAESGVSKGKAIYIGDSEVDVQTAHNAGLKCIGVTWGFRDKKELMESGAEFIADTANDVFEVITK